MALPGVLAKEEDPAAVAADTSGLTWAAAASQGDCAVAKTWQAALAAMCCQGQAAAGSILGPAPKRLGATCSHPWKWHSSKARR